MTLDEIKSMYTGPKNVEENALKGHEDFKRYGLQERLWVPTGNRTDNGDMMYCSFPRSAFKPEKEEE